MPKVCSNFRFFPLLMFFKISLIDTMYYPNIPPLCFPIHSFFLFSSLLISAQQVVSPLSLGVSFLYFKISIVHFNFIVLSVTQLPWIDPWILHQTALSYLGCFSSDLNSLVIIHENSTIADLCLAYN